MGRILRHSERSKEHPRVSFWRQGGQGFGLFSQGGRGRLWHLPMVDFPRGSPLVAVFSGADDRADDLFDIHR